MAEKIPTFEKAKVTSFLKLQRLLFPDGTIPDRKTVVADIQAGNPSVRNLFIAQMYRKGVKADPFLATDEIPETKEFASIFNETFKTGKTGGAGITKLASQAGSLVKNGVNLDDSFVNQKAKFVDVTAVSTTFGPLTKTFDVVTKDGIKAIQAVGEKGSKKLIDGLLPDEILDDVIAGIKGIDDPVLKDAVLASLLGYRGDALVEARTTSEFSKRTIPPRPYYNPDKGIMVNPPTGNKKHYGPDKELGPLFKSIMDRRYAAAGDTGVLFPNITTAQISDALKNIVFKNIRPEILDQLNRIPDGYTDSRRIVASVIANRMGNPEAARQIIGHTDDVMDDMNKVMTTFYADVVDEAGMATRKDIYFGFEGLMAKSIGQTSFQGLATELGLQIPDATEDIVYPDFKKGDATIGVNQQKKKLSAKEQKVQEQINLATMQDTLRGKEVSAAKKTKEKIELYKDISEEDIVKTGEKEALLEQTKTDTKTKLRSVQREEQKKKNKADAIEKNKKASKEAGDFFNDLFGPKVTKMESMMDTSGVKIGPTGEAVIEDKGLNVNIPNLSGLPPAIKAGTALLQGQEADKEVAAGFLGDVVRDSLIETGVAVGTKVLGAGKTLAAGLGGAATFLIDPNFPGQGKMGDQTLFGDKFEKLSPEQRQELGLKDSFLTTN